MPYDLYYYTINLIIVKEDSKVGGIKCNTRVNGQRLSVKISMHGGESGEGRERMLLGVDNPSVAHAKNRCV